MRYVTLIIPLVVAGGLLIGSQGLADEQYGQFEQFEQDNPQTQAQQLSKEQISEMQRLLTMQGYALGTRSGVLDENTKTAIRQFQMDNGLTVTSIPDDETLRALVSSSDQEEFFGLSPELDCTKNYYNQDCSP